MAVFQVMDEGGFFDGRVLHPQYTKIDIPPEKYKAWIGRSMRPLDKAAKEALATMAKHARVLKDWRKKVRVAEKLEEDPPDVPTHPFEPKGEDDEVPLPTDEKSIGAGIGARATQVEGAAKVVEGDFGEVAEDDGKKKPAAPLGRPSDA